MKPYLHTRDGFMAKGAVENDQPGQRTNTSMKGQLPHRNQDPLVKDNDTDFPEPGENEEHTGEPQAEALTDKDSSCEPKREINPEGVTQDQDPGHRQKQNQGGKKDDPLAA